MTELYLSRARLRRNAPVKALAALLVPRDGAARVAASHHLVWSLFADAPERTRDFLWREERPGHFLALSVRPPADPHGLFDLEFKPFAPDLAPSDRLGFSLRANAVISRQTVLGKRGKRYDIVEDAMYRVPPDPHPDGCISARARERPGVIATEGTKWLARQGEAHGFALPEGVNVDGYDTVRIPREPKDGDQKPKPIKFGTLDFTGVLAVTDPPRFLAALTAGFGRARAFGCGLMLIRRAP